MNNAPITILLIEDNPADARLLQKLLAKLKGTEFQLVTVESLREAINYLQEQNFDVILLDLSLPDSQGVETVKQIHAYATKLPIVVLTGLDDEEIAVEALRQGAQDYLVKNGLRPYPLVRAIHYAIERQQILERLQHLNDKLAQSNQELEQFAYVVSHDLQQPLQTVLGFSQLLANKYRGQFDEKADQYLTHLVNSSLRMGHLIKDLLTYSRIDNNSELEELTDANESLKLALSNLQKAIQETDAMITYHPLPQVLVAQVQLTQLFQNLISNSLKYCRPEIRPQIQISVKLQDNQWLFGVHDNGIGIEAKDFEHIFGMFQRLENNNDSSGTGIGLAICKKIVEYHGGRIWLESIPGSGTDFYFTLPKVPNR